MAIIHQATVVPSKLELLESWLPTQGWFAGDVPPRDLQRVTSCRFDDPAGQVGMEIFLARDGDGPLLHTPMTYREAPLAGAEQWLIGQTEHSVLGPRWVYDAAGDPVYVTALIEAIRTGGTEAPEYVETPGGPVAREPQMSVRGSGATAPGAAPTIVSIASGDPTVVATDLGTLEIRRVVDDRPAGSAGTLTATWVHGPTTVILAVLH